MGQSNSRQRYLEILQMNQQALYAANSYSIAVNLGDRAAANMMNTAVAIYAVLHGVDGIQVLEMRSFYKGGRSLQTPGTKISDTPQNYKDYQYYKEKAEFDRQRFIKAMGLENAVIGLEALDREAAREKARNLKVFRPRWTYLS